jgi:hypothetical protein
MKIIVVITDYSYRKKRRLPRDHGVTGHAEVVLGLVDVRVANPTVQNLDRHIFRASLPADRWTYDS